MKITVEEQQKRSERARRLSFRHGQNEGLCGHPKVSTTCQPEGRPFMLLVNAAVVFRHRSDRRQFQTIS